MTEISTKEAIVEQLASEFYERHDLHTWEDPRALMDDLREMLRAAATALASKARGAALEEAAKGERDRLFSLFQANAREIGATAFGIMVQDDPDITLRYAARLRALAASGEAE
jgi:hypothetical protein